MSGCKILINDIAVLEGEISLNIAILCDYDPHVISPKVKIIFENGDEIRRLPFPVASYFMRRESDEAVIICNYTFALNVLFHDHTVIDPINVHIELYYGEKELNNIPLFVSKGLIAKNCALNIPEEYISDNSFNGLTSYGNENMTRNPWFGKSEYAYSYDIDAPSGKIFIKKTPSETAIKKRPAILTVFFKYLMGFFNILICILLLPFLIFDGILSGLDLLPNRKYRPVFSVLDRMISQSKTNISAMLKALFKGDSIVAKLINPSKLWFSSYYKMCCKKPIVQNRIAFLSCRRDELSGNEKFVYDILKKENDIDFQFLFFSDVTGFKKKKNIKRFIKLYTTSKIVIVDDYYNLLNIYKKRKGVTLFQLWHACGAFKTFGFSRLAKKSGPSQTNPSHRMYDYATVSSSEIIKYYAEGFGISDKHVIPTGIPRTDIFMDESYAEKVKQDFYEKYPELSGKKIVLFAPTFRGNDKTNAYYPLNAFEPQNFIDKMDEDTVMIIKLHPFCTKKYVIEDAHKNRIYDFSDRDELNDLLFVTDLLITDYSSVVFEASLLNIPMLFYSFDLYEYISERDFYCDYIDFVPGKICYNEKDLITAAVNRDFCIEKVQPFKEKYFEQFDGKSSERVAEFILNVLRSNDEIKSNNTAEQAPVLATTS